MDIRLLAPRFHKLFAGLDRVYGTYVIEEVLESGKRDGRGVTRRGAVTDELWASHLDGAGIGITPIRDDGTCVFGAVDVDAYKNFEPAQIVARAAECDLPVVVCRSKSGGAHVYLFAAEPVPATLMRARLQEIAAALGRSGSEIFPKQNKLVSDEDCGAWINMPYCRGVEDGRYGVTISGQSMPPGDFLDFAEAMRRPLVWFEKNLKFEGEAFADGPVCLQILAKSGGFGEGSRNVLLANAATYSRLKGGEWKDRLYQINQTICSPPLGRDEVDGILVSYNRRGKAYLYQCTTEPLKSHCDGALCRERPYGVGRTQNAGSKKRDDSGEETGETVTESFPRLGQLRKLLVDPPVWFWDTDDGRTLELTTEELQSPRLFQKKCMETLNHMPTLPNQNAWTTFVSQALATAIEIDAPDDSSDEGQVWELLDKFCTGRVQARDRKEIHSGKPWTDEQGVTWFRLRDFQVFLDQKHFKSEQAKTHRLATLFHKRGMEHKFDVIGGKGGNLWGVKAFAPRPRLDVPEEITKEERPF